MVREVILSELEMDKTVHRKIDEFGQLSDEMDRLKNQLEGLKKRYTQVEDELRPILEELHRFGQKSLQTQRFLVSIKRMGYDRENLRYKETFEQSLEKVNKQTRKVLEELLQSTKTISRVVSSVGVQPVSEGFFSDLIKKVKSLFGRLVPQLKRTNKDMDELQRVSKLISK
jgi:septation ring formation regulator EzrA